MHPREAVDRALDLCTQGRTTREVARLVAVPETTVAHWRRGDRRVKADRTACPRRSEHALAHSYPYLLGTYLGDGHITVGRRAVQDLSIFCADAWPAVMDEVSAAMGEALGTGVCRVQRIGCVEVKSYSKHWTCCSRNTDRASSTPDG
jgi:hypothetical protein